VPHRSLAITGQDWIWTEGISYICFKLSEINQQRNHLGVTREVAGSIPLQMVAPTSE
jgi:hypothetical protein